MYLHLDFTKKTAERKRKERKLLMAGVVCLGVLAGLLELALLVFLIKEGF